MEFWKNGLSETSSEENDRPREKIKDEKGAAGARARRRSYECTYCRRGFTNAQALGGHMNIHRKDRAKAKQLLTAASNSNSPSLSIKPHHNDDDDDEDEDDDDDDVNYDHHHFAPLFSTHPPARRNHPANIYRRPPPENSSPRYPHAHDDHHENNHWSTPNLSLQIGPTYGGDAGIERRYGKEDEVDLELRLGHYP